MRPLSSAGHRKLRLLNAVGQLKNDAQHDPQHGTPPPCRTGARQPHRVEQQRNTECQGQEDRFAAEEDRQVPALQAVAGSMPGR